MFRSSNPTLNSSVFGKARSYGVGESMTMEGMVHKTFILLFIALASASWIWSKIVQPVPMFEAQATVQQSMSSVTPFITGGAILGLIAVFVCVFKLEWSPFLAPFYALCEGFVIGGVSAFYELRFPGMVIQAVALTFLVVFCMLSAYRSGMIRVTDKFRLGMFAAVGAIFLLYVVNFVMGFFGASIPFIFGAGPVGIGFSLIVVGIAALFLVIDFDMVHRLSQQGAPKYMEWYSALSLMVTLVWLYFEILRLLMKLRGGDR